MGGPQEDRPWGWWQVLDEGQGYKVKRIHVAPGCRLSYQRHKFRAEHWTVVAGTACCTLGMSERVLTAGESTVVPVGAMHRLANAGHETLVVIEVQVGSYTGEDDIVRIEDDYGRGDAAARNGPSGALRLHLDRQVPADYCQDTGASSDCS